MRRFGPLIAAACALACGPAAGPDAGSDSGTVPATATATPIETGADKPAQAADPGATPPEPAPAAGSGEAGEAETTSGTDADEATEAGAEGNDEGSGDEGPADRRPVPPSGYGEFKFSQPVPAEPALTHVARAGYGVVAIYEKPTMDSAKIGFLRLGMTTKAGDKIASSDCRKGWYPLEVGGFACASKGLMVEKSRAPFMKEPPDAPDKAAAFPYKWAYVKTWNSPMWWRPPTADERALASKVREIREAERTGEPLPSETAKPSETPPPSGSAKPAAAGDGGGAEADTAGSPVAADASDPAGPPDLSALPTVDGPPVVEDPQPAKAEDPQPAEASKPDPAPKPATAEPTAPPAEEGPTLEEQAASLPLSPDNPWLEKGYFLSVDRKVRENGKTWWHTSRGGYVLADDAYEYKPKNFEGVVLGPELELPIGWVMKKTAKVYTLTDDDKVQLSGKLERRDFLNLVEEIEIRGKAYMLTDDDRLVRKKDLVMPEPQAVPKGLDPWERWIDVDLDRQILVGYEGEYPAFATLVSTGKKGTEDESFETPAGRYRIVSKQITSNMDGSTATDGNYAIQDVPWVMYFEGSYALHGAFWHRSFGYTRSHGCVNLGPSDARWLFNWTTPFVPDGWHGAHSGDDNPGTTIIIRRGE
jgi:hypothetical protein